MKYLFVFKNISESCNFNIAMKYFAVFNKNGPTIFQLQWNIGNMPDIFLQYSVLCEFSYQRLETQLMCANFAPDLNPVCANCAASSLINCFLRKILSFSYKYSISIVSLNIKDYKIVSINLIHLKFALFNDLIQWLQS